MNVSRRILLLSVVAILVVIGAAPQDAYAGNYRFKRDFSALYVFGDSLSDPGNTYFIRGEINQPPWEPIPELPYDSRRFSNGKTWVEILAKETRNYRGALPAYKHSRFGNYAVAGARAQGVGAEKPSFGDQVQKYLGVTGGTADANALYVVAFGGNDIRDALVSAQAGGNPAVVIGGAIQALAYNIGLLREAGARKFLVANAPNLGKAPVIAVLGAEVPAEHLSLAFNAALDGVLVQLAASGLEIYRLDLFSFVSVATEMPHGFGFADATTPCLQVFTPPATGVCEDPDQRLFWDGIHPTRAGHRLIGSIAINSLSLR
jgi:phospholipase/lecithinase/hemolysin